MCPIPFHCTHGVINAVEWNGGTPGVTNDKERKYLRFRNQITLLPYSNCVIVVIWVSLFCVSSSRVTMGWSVVRDCDISWSYSVISASISLTDRLLLIQIIEFISLVP